MITNHWFSNGVCVVLSFNYFTEWILLIRYYFSTYLFKPTHWNIWFDLISYKAFKEESGASFWWKKKLQSFSFLFTLWAIFKSIFQFDSTMRLLWESKLTLKVLVTSTEILCMNWFLINLSKVNLKGKKVFRFLFTLWAI